MKLNRNELCYILNEAARHILNEISVSDAYASYYSDIPQEDYMNIIHTLQGDNDILDPEMRNVLKLYRKDSGAFISNLDAFHDAFKLWKRAKDRGMLPSELCDLNWFENAEEFISFIGRLNRNEIEKRTKGELSRDINAAKNDIDVVYEDEDWYVLVPKSYEASCYWGNQTNWCTATRETDRHYKHYTEDGDKLYININKKTREKFQFSLTNFEFNDANNYSIDCPLMYTIKASDGLKKFYKNLIGNDEKLNNIFFVWDIDFSSDWCNIDDNNSVIEIKVGDKYRYIDRNFNFLDDLMFDEISDMYANIGISTVVIDDQCYLYNFFKALRGENPLSSNSFDSIELFINTGGFMRDDPNYYLAVVEKNGKFNIINGNGKITSEIWFDDVDIMGLSYGKNGYAILGNNTLQVDKQGKVTKN